MKKLSVLFLAVMMSMVFVAPSFAILRKDLQSVKGVVSYVNSARTEITVKDSTSGRDVTFSSPGVPVDIMSGNLVVILYKTGTTTAKTVRVVPAKKGAAPVAASYTAPKAVSSNSYTMPKTTTPTTKKTGW